MFAAGLCVLLAVFAAAGAKELPTSSAGRPTERPTGVDCSAIQCAFPNCERGFVATTLEGECCPSCQACPPRPCPLIWCPTMEVPKDDPCGCPVCVFDPTTDTPATTDESTSAPPTTSTGSSSRPTRPTTRPTRPTRPTNTRPTRPTRPNHPTRPSRPTRPTTTDGSFTRPSPLSTDPPTHPTRPIHPTRPTRPSQPTATKSETTPTKPPIRVPDKNSKPTKEETIVIPKKDPTVPPQDQECDVPGQVFMECGTACPAVCGEEKPMICTLQCVIGCQCPQGTMLDKLAERCVTECTDVAALADRSSAKACKQELDVGPCRGAFARFYYNTDTSQCEEFIYGGCMGNGNNFKSLQECQKTCM